jgi:uncharacterized protein (DUF58 family)
MTATATVRLRAYSAAATVLTLVGVAAARPGLVGLAAPFWLYLVTALTFESAPSVAISVRPRQRRVLAGEDIDFDVTLMSDRGVAGILLDLTLPTFVHVEDAPGPIALAANERRALTFRVVALTWGVLAPGPLRVTARGRLGVLAFTRSAPVDGVVRVYPRADRLRRLVSPVHSSASGGARRAPRSGDGIEFAEIRPFTTGDRPRRVNWRVSARRDSLYVNRQHTEHSSDVVLLLDTFAHAGSSPTSTLDAGVTAADALARGYLARRDRVGVVGFGGVLHWLLPGTGPAALYRIADALIVSEVVFSYVWKDVAVIPPHLLPPRALIVAVTPMLDERFVHAVFELRGRGYDIAVVEVAVPALILRDEDLASRLWALDRAALRRRLAAIAVAAVSWNPERPIQPAVEEVEWLRRSLRIASRIA